MKLIPITPDLLRFDSCGRLVPPEGYAFLDLFRVIPARLVQPAISEGEPLSAPVTRRVSNQAGTVFYALGLAGESGLSFSLRWPSGRSLSVRRSIQDSGINFPLGLSNRQWCFEVPVPMGPGDNFSIETPAGVGGSVDVQLWGYLRWLLTAEDAAAVNCNCLVGYPVEGKAINGASAAMLPGVAQVQETPRYSCDPVGQNLMASASDLGNQCYPGEPAMFATDAVVLGPNEAASDLRVQVPFIGVAWLVGVRLRCVWTDWPEDLTSDIFWALRMPDGYQLTGSDLVSNSALGHTPVMPSIPIRSGERMSFDVWNKSSGTSDTAQCSIVIEFLVRRGL